ncbi:hypothetical protein EDB81DRAFT_768446 [Dactylonectria macrodidyma]|uniref:FAD linked oxidase N-terminal domain-containing protein n=1 Tax=Dactylonectria macrodidyma TaxID=307937 RepID=A0A9P9IA28_9HYPO|nr:hypothetical protein EDB81DRAFT_768446 [Dactylonectria macrodidyma]
MSFTQEQTRNEDRDDGPAEGLVAAACASASKVCADTDRVSSTCQVLKKTHPHITLLPDDAGYTNETEVSWSTNAWLKTACVFVPKNAQDLSYAVKLFERDRMLFAMRGGGHMPDFSTSSQLSISTDY